MMSRTRGALGPAYNRLGPVFPEVAHRFPIEVVISSNMPAVDNPEEIVVSGEFQRLIHFLVEQEPVAGADFPCLAFRW